MESKVRGLCVTRGLTLGVKELKTLMRVVAEFKRKVADSNTK